MKKIVLALLIAAMVSGGAFAMDQSVGGGLGLTADFQSIKFTSDFEKAYKNGTGEDIGNVDTSLIGLNIYGFYDITYAMFTLGMSFLNAGYVDADRQKALDDSKITTTIVSLELGAYGKFPIAMGDGGANFFPMIGAEFRMVTDYIWDVDGTKYGISDTDMDLSGLNTIWVKAGIGFDIPLGDQLYLRPTVLYGIGTLNKYDQEDLDDANKGDPKMYESVVNHGLDVKIAIGFKL